jgi:hypothetical protein
VEALKKISGSIKDPAFIFSPKFLGMVRNYLVNGGTAFADLWPIKLRNQPVC